MDGSKVTATAVVVALCAVFAGGCDCEKHRDAMERIADKGFEDAFQCCRALAETNPSQGEECFHSLSAWRAELATLIVQWYQACLDGNHELAAQILHSLRAIFVSRFGTECPPVSIDPAGEHRTAGILFTRADSIRLAGAFVPAPGHRDDAGGGTTFVLRGGAFHADLYGVAVDGTLVGELHVTPRGATHRRTVDRCTLAFTTPLGAVRCTLDGTGGRGEIVEQHDEAVLQATLRLVADDALGVLVPSEAWLRLRLAPQGDGYALVEDTQQLRGVAPPALGFADWVCDGHVGLDDWAAYFRESDAERDLDLDGDVDEDDDALFIRSWRDAAGE